MDEPEEKRRDDDKHSFIGNEPPQNAAIEKLLLNRGVDQRGKGQQGQGDSGKRRLVGRSLPRRRGDQHRRDEIDHHKQNEFREEKTEIRAEMTEEQRDIPLQLRPQRSRRP